MRSTRHLLCPIVVAAIALTPLFAAAQTAAAQTAAARPTVKFENPFATPHRLQPVQSELAIAPDLLPRGTALTIEALNRHVGLQDEASGEVIRVQWSDLQAPTPGGTARATANYLLDLPARTTRVLKLVGPLAGPLPKLPPISVTAAKVVEVRTGRLAVQLAGVGSTKPPIVQIGRSGDKPADKIQWRGRSKFLNTAALQELTVEPSAVGPVFFRQTNTYRFADGVTYRCSVTCWAGLDYLTTEESITGPAHERMRWLFDLDDWPTHIYTAGHGPTHKFVSSYRHSGAYLDIPLVERKPGEELLWLPNYLIWSRFEDALLACFVRSAAGPGGTTPFAPDMLMLFQIRRGEWEDDLWAKVSRRPLGEQPWQPWSQRRWWGSPFSAIRVTRNGHPQSGASITFSLAPGTRAWGMWLGDSATLPRPRTKLDAAPLPSLVRAAAGEVRLTELQHRILSWRPDPKVVHPRMEMTPDLLRDAKRKAASDPFFAAAFATLQKDGAVRALLTRDKQAAAAIAQGVLSDLNSRFNFPTSDGIEFSSHLSPVGIRPVYQHASTIDVLLGAPDLLDEPVQQQLRERFAYLAYLLADSSFMAHKYNAGHPNFDADRYVALAGIALLYPDHPHSRQWLDHAVAALREAMRIYVIPQSGKWAENLGGYYNWSSTILGGMARALSRTGAADPYAWPEFQNFWYWGLVTALPPKPGIEQIGAAAPPSLGAGSPLRRIRQVPGIGDNGGDGGVDIHGGYALAAAGILPHNPQLGRQLLWLWDQGGRQGYSHYPYALFFGLDAEHLRLARDPKSSPVSAVPAQPGAGNPFNQRRSPAQSQVLQGYGSVFRADFGLPSESYLLFKAGPGGYRYHGEEGSFVLFALGQPLTLDGGNNFRPDQHSTVTFGPDRAGVERGRLVQFDSTDQLDYACGRFPGTPQQLGRAIKPQDRDDDVLSRQILFRKSDYLVLCDHIRSVQPAQWHLLLLAEELKLAPGRVQARGWLGVDVTLSLFQVKGTSGKLEPIPVSQMTVEAQPLKQQRLTVALAPGVSIVAVLDFNKTGQRPWTVATKGNALVLEKQDATVREIIELNAPVVTRWKRFERGQESASWHSSGDQDPWKKS